MGKEREVNTMLRDLGSARPWVFVAIASRQAWIPLSRIQPYRSHEAEANADLNILLCLKWLQHESGRFEIRTPCFSDCHWNDHLPSAWDSNDQKAEVSARCIVGELECGEGLRFVDHPQSRSTTSDSLGMFRSCNECANAG